MRDPSPRPRLVLFFYENELIGISHTRGYVFDGFWPNVGVRGELLSISTTGYEYQYISEFKEYYYELMRKMD